MFVSLFHADLPGIIVEKYFVGEEKLIVMFHGSQSSSCKLKLHSTLLNTKKIGFGKLPRPWRCDCHLPDKPCSSNAYLWAHTLGSDSHWTKQNLINRLGLKKHLKRQLIMFYMTGNATQKQKRSELLNKHFHHRMAPSSKIKKKKKKGSSDCVKADAPAPPSARLWYPTNRA